jgi:hypothetical protein
MKMRFGMAACAAVVVLGLLPAKGFTQCCTPSIALDNVATLGGQVSAGGNYQIPCGYTFVSVTVEVRPTGGAAGEGGSGSGSANGKGDFTAMVSVPAGQYDVQATLTVTDGCGGTLYFFSNTVVDVIVSCP